MAISLQRYFACLLVAAGSLVPVLAQEADQPSPSSAAAVQAQEAGVNAARLDNKTTGSNVRVSQLIGTNLQNDQGQNVGEINDLVIDANTGRVRYAAVTYGGFLGLGDKLFAVPFEAFKVRQDPDDASDYVMILNVTQQQLEGAQGFDQDRWPNMADATWAQDLDRRYNIDRTPATDGQNGVRVDVGNGGVRVDTGADRPVDTTVDDTTN